MKRKEQFMDYMSSLYDNLEFELKNENIIKILKNKMNIHLVSLFRTSLLYLSSALRFYFDLFF